MGETIGRSGIDGVRTLGRQYNIPGLDPVGANLLYNSIINYVIHFRFRQETSNFVFSLKCYLNRILFY